MSVITQYPFTTPGNYTYDPALIEVTGGVCQLVVGDDIGQTFNQDFAVDTGFTYNASNTEFVAGQVQQIQKTYRPTYYLGTFFSDYDTNIDGTYGDGVLTGTGTGGASVSGGNLDLSYNDLRYVSYAGAGNVEASNRGCIRFKYIPNYNGSPATRMNIVSISQAAGNVNNELRIYHETTGQVTVYGRTAVGAGWMLTVTYGAFVAALGVSSEWEFNWDSTVGANRMFIDGNQLGATDLSTGVRSSNIGLLRVGSDLNATTNSNFEINDLMIFSDVQHTANYVPAPYGLLDPQYPTFYAGYGEDENADWSDGVGTGTLSGAAAVSGGELDLNQGALAYCDYTGANIVSDLIQEATIIMKVTPDYSGTPGTTQNYFVISKASGDGDNFVNLYHSSATGNLILVIRDSAGIDIVAGVSLGVWAPVATTEYELCLSFNVVAGETRVFVDGTQFGATQTATGTRDNGIGLFRIGTNLGIGDVADFTTNDILLYKHAIHYANYTPDWTDVLPYEYYGDFITLPTMTYPGIGNIQAWTNIVSTEGNTPRYIMNGQYYSGGWIASSDTWATASPLADVLTNIATLPASDTMVIDIVTQDSVGVQMSVDDLTLTYTGQAYSTTNPTIVPSSAMSMDEMVDFTETATAAGGDAIEYTLQYSSTEYWYNGVAWAVSTGTYGVDTNTATEISINAATFLPGGSPQSVVPVCYLHSNDGSTTPQLDLLAIQYDYYAPSPAAPNQCAVYGYLKDAGGNVLENARVTAQLNMMGIYNSTTLILPEPYEIKTDSNGFFQLPLVETANMQVGIGYIFSFEYLGNIVETSLKSIPDQVSADYGSL